MRIIKEVLEKINRKRLIIWDRIPNMGWWLRLGEKNRNKGGKQCLMVTVKFK